MRFGKYGVEFEYNSDAVIWVFPWKRKLNGDKAFYSLSFHAPYSSLKELDEEWEGYFEACKKTSND